MVNGLRSWCYNRRRSWLAIMTVTLAASLMATLFAIAIGIGDKMSMELKSYGANIQILPVGQALLPTALTENTPLEASSLLDTSHLSEIKSIFWRHHIIGYAPHLNSQVMVEGKMQPIVGTYFHQAIPLPDEADFATGHQTISKFWNIDGRWPQDAQDEILVGYQLAERQGWKVGQTIVLQADEGVAAVITGLLHHDRYEQHIIAPLRMVQVLTGIGERAHSVTVSALTTPEDALSEKARQDIESLDMQEYDKWFCTSYVSTVAFQIEQVLTGVVVQPIWQIAASEGVLIKKIQALLFVVALAALAAAAIGIAALMRNTLLERLKEVGLMTAIGAHTWQVLWLFYIESLCNGALGGLLGCAFSVLLSKWMMWHLFAADLTYAWIVVPFVLLLSMGVALVGTWFAVRRMHHMKPVEILYGHA